MTCTDSLAITDYGCLTSSLLLLSLSLRHICTDVTRCDCDCCCRHCVQTYEQAGYHYLEVCDVTADDSGMYVGTVHNSAGTDTASAELDVFGQ